MNIFPDYELLRIALRHRRQKLASLIDFPTILWSGSSVSRNYPALKFPFRASSHFLYFAGLPLENAAIRLESGRLELFMDDALPSSTLWHGEMPKRAEIAERIGADAAFPMSELKLRGIGAATITVQDSLIQSQQSQMLDRPLTPSKSPAGIDLELTKAIISLRLTQDTASLAELRSAAAVTVEAHKAGMAATATAQIEAGVRAAMESAIISQNMTTAYPSIVTVHGEILHSEHYHHALQAGDLLLADVGAETSTGWAADVTR
ncbi:aminopeptidase P family protein, partial [Tychonema sp. BBK16]